MYLDKTVGTYSGNVARTKTENLHRDAVVRRHMNWDFKNNKAFKSKEMMNSSNCILVTYLSDIESKFIHYVIASGFWLTYPFSSIDDMNGARTIK